MFPSSLLKRKVRKLYVMFTISGLSSSKFLQIILVFQLYGYRLSGVDYLYYFIKDLYFYLGQLSILPKSSLFFFILLNLIFLCQHRVVSEGLINPINRQYVVSIYSNHLYFWEPQTYSKPQCVSIFKTAFDDSTETDNFPVQI